MRNRRFVIALVLALAFLFRLVVGLCSPFWTTDDEKQIYLIGLKFYATQLALLRPRRYSNDSGSRSFAGSRRRFATGVITGSGSAIYLSESPLFCGPGF